MPAGDDEDTKKATRAAAGDVTTGDRAIARLKAEDTGAPAVFLYFLTKQTDLAQRQKKTDDEWQTQSVNGTVKSVDTAAKQIVALVRGGFGPAKDVTLDATGPVEFLRFSLDTGKYEPSTAGLAQIQTGDQVRLHMLKECRSNPNQVAKPSCVRDVLHRPGNGEVSRYCCRRNSRDRPRQQEASYDQHQTRHASETA